METVTVKLTRADALLKQEEIEKRISLCMSEGQTPSEGDLHALALITEALKA